MNELVNGKIKEFTRQIKDQSKNHSFTNSLNH